MRRAVQVLRVDLAKVIGPIDADSFANGFSAVAFPVIEDEEPLDVLAELLTNHLGRAIAASDLAGLQTT